MTYKNESNWDPQFQPHFLQHSTALYLPAANKQLYFDAMDRHKRHVAVVGPQRSKLTPARRSTQSSSTNARRIRSANSIPTMDNNSMLVMEANEIVQCLQKDYVSTWLFFACYVVFSFIYKHYNACVWRRPVYAQSFYSCDVIVACVRQSCVMCQL